MSRSFHLRDLTIILTAHNAATTIDQTFGSLEPVLAEGASLILVDDASTDRTPGLIDDFAGSWPNIEAIHLDQSHGAGPARNLGIDRVTTGLVASIDADDWVSPSYYRSLIRRMNMDPAVDFVRSHYCEANGPARRLVRAPFGVVETPFDPRLAILPVHVSTLVDLPQMWAGLYSVEFLNRYGIRYDTLPTAEDRIFNWKTQVLGTKMVIAEETGIFYRRGNSASLTGIGDDRQLAFLDALHNVVSFLSECREEVFIPKALRQLTALVCHHINRQDRLHPETREKLYKRASALLRAMPASEMYQTVAGLDRRRAKIIRHLMSC